MKYLDKKEIEGLQQYFADMENIEDLRMNGLYGGIQKSDSDEFSNKKISTKIVIDFFLNAVKLYLVIPQKEMKVEKTIDEQGNEKEIIKNVIIKKEKQLKIAGFKISEDYKSVTVDDKTYIIPDFFDQEAVKNKDNETWQIIFYQVFYDEIMKEINGK